MARRPSFEDRQGELMQRLPRIILVVLILAVGAYGAYSYQTNRTTKTHATKLSGRFFAPENNLAGAEIGDLDDLEKSVKSEYSNIRIRRTNDTRTLSFIRDNGEEVIESSVNLNKPHDLLIDYTRFMFLSYIFRPKQEKVLIVGLGGGAMIHFLRHYDPSIKIDVLEIDPAIVKIADEYFGIQPSDNVKILTVDGFKYLKETESRYDVIYMDAFLKPSADTDRTGVPLRLKTIDFYKDIQKKLTPDGLVVFNVNPHETVQDDIKNITAAFPQTYVFELPRHGGYVVVGSMSRQRLERNAILAEAAVLDRRFKGSYSYPEMARSLIVER
jgi:spermidine synthase